jgi:RTX calcium-binding nonapeptide repeat (4 copies)
VGGVFQGAFSPTGRLIADGLDGNDNLQVAGSLSHSAWLDGGPGQDRLQGGAGDDVLRGGDGDDLLLGGAGRDLPIGGSGADRLVGNRDDDILMAGTTAFDGNDQALAAVLAEWTSARDYATRLANLRGEGTGARLNGDIVLTVDCPQATVFDDEDADRLTGSSGLDWFFAHRDGGTLDTITGRHDAEFADELGCPADEDPCDFPFDISGGIFEDINHNGSIDGDPLLTGIITVFVNLSQWADGDGQGDVDAGELTPLQTIATSTGTYRFADLGPLGAGEEYHVNLTRHPAFAITVGFEGYVVDADSGCNSPDNPFAVVFSD